MKKVFKPLIMALVALFATLEAMNFPESFNSLPLGESRKQEFTARLTPIIEAENKKILHERQMVLTFFDNFLWNLHIKLHSKEFIEIVKLANRYKIGQFFWRDEYLRRIDIIPVSLALAQAALESGWGNSFYSRKYNNIFGEYTMRSSVSSRKIAGSKKRIRIFENITQAVQAYMWNLNTHNAYKDFRQERFLAHAKGQGYTGFEALEFLLAYSEIREEYARKVANLISKNLFERFDWKFYRETYPLLGNNTGNRGRLNEIWPNKIAM